MLGAVAGDIIGSPYEHHPIKTEDFPLFTYRSHFTDDTVMTIAVAYAILNDLDFGPVMQLFGRKYPDAGYGKAFKEWIYKPKVEPYNSWGNGSAMRVSPIGWVANSVEEVFNKAKTTAEVSHNHPNGIKGAQATALAIFLARKGSSKNDIRQEISQQFGYNLQQTLSEIRPDYHFDVTCDGTVPQAIIAFLESANYEDAVRKAVSLGGDSDTLACITGGIAEAFYKDLSEEIVQKTREMLPDEFLLVIDEFHKKYKD